MNTQVSAWLMVGPTIDAQFKNYDPENPGGGTMDERSYNILNTFADYGTVQPLYKLKGQFYIYALNFPDEATAIDDIDYLNGVWPRPQIEPYGMWYHENGLQAGMSYTYDDEGNIIGVEGTPVYPIPSDCYLVMPDVVVYDENGNEISRTPASSNADLRDINLIQGQAERDFTQYGTFFSILKWFGEQNDPAILQVEQGLVAGQVVTIGNNYIKPSGASPDPFTWTVQTDVTKEQIAQAISAVINNEIRYDAIVVGNRIYIQPEQSNRTLQLMFAEVA